MVNVRLVVAISEHDGHGGEPRGCNDVLQLAKSCVAGQGTARDGSNESALLGWFSSRQAMTPYGASITVIHRGRGSTLATRTRWRRGRRAAVELGEAPAALAERDANYLLFDVADDRALAPLLARIGGEDPYVRTVLQLEARTRRPEPVRRAAGCLHTEDIDLATVFAAHTSAWSHCTKLRQRGQLGTALKSNREIGVAMGILMAHHKVTQDTLRPAASDSQDCTASCATSHPRSSRRRNFLTQQRVDANGRGVLRRLTPFA